MQSSQSATSTPAKATPAGKKGMAREAIEIVLLVAVIFFAIKLSFESRPISGISMEPTLHDSQQVFVNKLAYVFGTPQRGDVLIFYYPYDQSQIFVKRVIGVPGDTIALTQTTVSVNGHVLKEPYLSAPSNPIAQTVKLGPTQYWVQGDNRPASDDSRYWGVLDKKYVIGKVEAVWWPLNQFHGVSDHREVFAQVGATPMPANDAPYAVFTLPPLAAAGTRRILAPMSAASRLDCLAL